jgi:hypothetical protein
MLPVALGRYEIRDRQSQRGVPLRARMFGENSEQFTAQRFDRLGGFGFNALRQDRARTAHPTRPDSPIGIPLTSCHAIRGS